MDEIVKLKRRIRRLELLACLLMAGCGAMTLTAFQSAAPKTIRAERFEMVDAQTRVRGNWRMTDDGTAAFTLYDGEGRSRVAMGAAPSGASEIAVSSASGAVLEADGRTPYVKSTSTDR